MRYIILIETYWLILDNIKIPNTAHNSCAIVSPSKGRGSPTSTAALFVSKANAKRFSPLVHGVLFFAFIYTLHSIPFDGFLVFIIYSLA